MEMVKPACSKTSSPMYGDAFSKATAWVATPFSSRPYYPMTLGNGSDFITIDYMGSMLCGLDGHAHKEQHQGLIPGWYKVAQRVMHIPPRLSRAHPFPSLTCFTQPTIQAGVNIRVNGEITEASHYVQSFDARRAILSTEITLFGGHWRSQTYLTDDHLWVERLEVLRLPRGQTIDVVFFIRPVTAPTAAGTMLCRQSKLDIKPLPKEGAVAFDYTLAPNDFHGRGVMWASPKGKIGISVYPGCAEIIFSGIKPGFAATRYLVAVDDAETSRGPEEARASYRRLKACAETDIRKTHVKVWTDFSRQSSLAVPDREYQQLYDLSMYWMRANQYPKTGSLNLGPFPCHWGGGANAIWDAGIMQVPLLASNHVQESRNLLEFYRMRMPRARVVAKTLGYPGARLCFFAAANGQDAHADPESMRHEKIIFNATACLSFYDHWRIAGRDDSLEADLGIMRELLDHVLAVAVMEKDDRAYIVDAFGASEGRCLVSNDSFLATSLARALRGYCEMAEASGMPAPERYRAVAVKLAQGLRENYRRGIIMADKNAAQGGGSPLLALLNLPDALKNDYTPKSLEYWMRDAKTPWGFDKPQKNYRDWPWSHCWLSIIFSHWGWGRKAFKELRLAMKDCSSLGAMPEKIRLDSYAINYWYTSTHASYLQAFQTALCHDRTDDAIGLLQGMDGTWQDLKFDQLRMRGGLLVSLKIKKGRVRELVLRNAGVRPVQRKLIWNSRYACALSQEVFLRPGQTTQVC